MATMAATVAASIPAAQAAPAPAAPTYEAIPPSMSKVIDTEAEIPIETVQLDGLVNYNPFHLRNITPSSFPFLPRIHRL